MYKTNPILRILSMATILSLMAHTAAHAANASLPGALTEELPTLKCLGVRWLIGGDDNANAAVTLRYRKAGEAAWHPGLDLFRVETAAIREPVRPPAGQVLFAGSLFGLAENTPYDVQLTLHDPDGGDTTRTLRMKTWAEPRLPQGGQQITVRPGELQGALAKAKPGDTLLLEPGTYQGLFKPRSGEPDKPIAIIGSRTGETILDGQGNKNLVDAGGRHDLIFERLTLRNARWAIAANGGSDITIRRCRFESVDFAFVGCRAGEAQKHFFIADNVMRGPCTWPRTKGIEDQRGIQVSGQGHVICHNRISNFGDAIDTFHTSPCNAIDFYNNDISECTDDGIEMDYSDANTRCFENRFTNVFQGISLQPVYGGPVYVFRNALYNVGMETFKLHNHPSGTLLFHNTCVKAGMPLLLYTNQSVSHCITRNNLFVGTRGDFAYEATAPMRECDFDFDGFAGQWRMFLKWNRKRYATIADAAKDGVYAHAVHIAEPVFQSGVKPPDQVETQYKTDLNDLRLATGSNAIDRGATLPNINDGFTGQAPDLGAYELGAPVPHYGPRPE